MSFIEFFVFTTFVIGLLWISSPIWKLAALIVAEHLVVLLRSR